MLSQKTLRTPEHRGSLHLAHRFLHVMNRYVPRCILTIILLTNISACATIDIECASVASQLTLIRPKHFEGPSGSLAVFCPGAGRYLNADKLRYLEWGDLDQFCGATMCGVARVFDRGAETVVCWDLFPATQGSPASWHVFCEVVKMGHQHGQPVEHVRVLDDSEKRALVGESRQ